MIKKKEQTDDDGNLNVWLDVEPWMCNSCRQDTHSFDADCAPKRVWLRWVKKRLTKKGVSVPMGTECYICFATRRRCFKESAEDLINARKENVAIEERWARLRRMKARGDGIPTNESKVSVKDTLSVASRSYEDVFEEIRLLHSWGRQQNQLREKNKHKYHRTRHYK